MKRTLFTLFVLTLFTCNATADPILITEVVTDPQLDHSESSGGNMIPFDNTPGSGTISSVDEFIELYNAGSEPVDLTGYTLRFNDTSPATFVFGTTRSGVLRFTDGSSLTALLAGAYVLLGNPPGAMNNKISIVLVDGAGATVDSLMIDNGAALHAGVESIARIWGSAGYLGKVFRDSFTPLTVSNAAPVPESPVLALLAISGLAAVGAAMSRRVRRALGHTRRVTLRLRSFPG